MSRLNQHKIENKDLVFKVCQEGLAEAPPIKEKRLQNPITIYSKNNEAYSAPSGTSRLKKGKKVVLTVYFYGRFLSKSTATAMAIITAIAEPTV